MRLALLLLVVAFALPAGARAEDEGQALYRARCAACHEGGVARAPDRPALKMLAPAQIRAALTSGSMSRQGEGLASAQLDALIAFLAPAPAGRAATANAACADRGGSLAGAFDRPHWNGWGVDLSERRSQPAAMARLSAAEVPRLKLKWAFGFAGVNRAYAQPAVVGGRLFVGSASGTVYALDAKSGCVYWTFTADAPVRTAMAVGEAARGWSVYFGDQRAHAYAVDALSGERRWKTQVDEHRAAMVTGASVLAGKVLYVPVTSTEEVMGAALDYPCCSFRGSVVALDAVTGKLLWKGYSITDPPQPVRKNTAGVQLWGPSGAAIWSAPSVDLERRVIYATTGDSYSDPPAATSDAFLAFDLATGRMLWSRQMTAGDAFTVACPGSIPGQGNCPKAGGPDLDFGSSPILVELAPGRRALIAGQKSGMVHAIDPDRQGAILWQRRVGRGGPLGGVQWGAAADAEKVYVAVSDARVLVASEAAPGAQKAASGRSYRLDPEIGGGLYALNLATGAVVWHTPHPGCHDAPGCSPAQSAAVTTIPGIVFSGGLDGHLRAYASESGKTIWDVDTVQSYKTVNGVAAHGGALDGPGPVVVDGMLYVNSGYAFIGSMPGNVLLAFSVDGR